MATPRRPTAKQERAYRYLIGCENAGTAFSAADLAKAAGWLDRSTATTLRRQLASVATRNGHSYVVNGVAALTLDEFVRLMSQVHAVHRDPIKPELDPDVEALVAKAREAALAAMQMYNNPIGVYRTETYAVLMMVAWTALAHAEFTRDGTCFDVLDPAGNPNVVDGEPRAWELKECLRHLPDLHESVRKNIELFIRIRNWIVHRGVRGIDAALAGEAQALLLNFDQRLVVNFGAYYAIGDSVAPPLLTGNVRHPAHLAALSARQKHHFDEVMAMVNDHRRSLADDVYQDPRYSFRIFAMPRPGNRESTADLVFHFVKADEVPADIAEFVKNRMIAERIREVPVANLGNRLPRGICLAVAERTGIAIQPYHHAAAWKRYGARQLVNAKWVTDSRHCVQDDATKQFVYTPAWVEFLVQKLADPTERAALKIRDR